MIYLRVKNASISAYVIFKRKYTKTSYDVIDQKTKTISEQ